MRPIHLLAVFAVAAVGLLAYFALQSGASRRTDRAGPVREEPREDPVVEVPEVRFRVTVAVRMPDGSAAVDAQIELSGETQRSARTDEMGKARLEDLRRGSYSLTARKDRAAGMLEFDLDADQDLGTVDLAAGLLVRGQVYGQKEAPYAGAVVEATKAPETPKGGYRLPAVTRLRANPVVAKATSGGDGRYELILPGGGTYAFRALAGKGGADTMGYRPVVRDIEGLDFHLQAAQTIAGQVVSETNAPIAGARVFAYRQQGGIASPLSLGDATTGPDGRFSIQVPIARQVGMVVKAEGYAPHVDSRVYLPAEDLSITLKAGATLRLRTVIKDSGGRPAAGVDAYVSTSSGLETGTTDQFGEVTIENVPVGPRGVRQVMLAGGNFVPQRALLKGVQPVDGVLDLGVVEMEVGAVLRGRVLDRETGGPIAGAAVRPFSRAAFQIAMTVPAKVWSDQDGGYELRGVPLDTFAVLAEHERYVAEQDMRQLLMSHRQTTDSLFAEGSMLAEHDVYMLPAKTITGTVLAPDNSPVAGARVSPSQRFGFSTVAVVVSDENGAFTLEGLRPEQRVTLVAHHDHYGRSESLKADAGNANPVILRLKPPVRLEGQVVDREGAPVEQAKVLLRRLRERPGQTGEIRPGVTDAKGEYVLRNAAPGEVTIRFEHDDYRVLESQVTIDAKSATHDLGKTVLERGPMIEGLVVDPEGAPIPAVIVNARSTDARGMSAQGGRGWVSARTDDEGRFVLRGLNDGNYTLRAQGEGLFSERPTVAAGSADVRILVKKAVQWRCRVVSGITGIEGAWARAELPNRGGYLGAAMTNADGYFTMTGLPPDATFDLTITHGDYKTLEIEGTSVSPGTAVHQLDAGGRIAGMVVDPDGKPVAEAQMRIYHHGKNTKWARTDEEGRFEVSGLDEGHTAVEVNWTPEGHIPTGKISVRLGDLDLRIEVKAGLRIEGHVVAVGEASLQSLRVSALDAEGKSVRSAWVWSDSSKKEPFVLQGLPPGTYTVRVDRMGKGVLAELPGVEAGAANLEFEIPE